MKDKSKAISTRELWARLFHAPDLDQFLMDNQGYCETRTFAAYITELCQSRGEKPEKIIRRAEIERSFGHRLFSGTRNPSRDTVLQLAFGFELSTDETQQLLRAAHATPLHPKVKRDAILAFCLHNGKSVVETQQILDGNQLPLLGGAKYERAI